MATGDTNFTNVDVSGTVKVGGTQVLTSQQTAIADLNQTISGPTAAEVQAISDKVDAILAMLRTHGIIAT